MVRILLAWSQGFAEPVPAVCDGLQRGEALETDLAVVIELVWDKLAGFSGSDEKTGGTQLGCHAQACVSMHAPRSGAAAPLLPGNETKKASPAGADPTGLARTLLDRLCDRFGG
jgi:hypothetical protein